MTRKTPKIKIIDVRNADEFEAGHAEGSINIPLPEIETRLEEFKNMKEQIVLVCGGGTRHLKAHDLLSLHGISSEAGGGWKEVNKKY